MDKKGREALTPGNVSFLIILVLFIIGLFAFVQNQRNGASVWEDFYAKEIVKMINMAEPGDIIDLDVHKGTEIAKKNRVQSQSDLFRIDNKNKEVCVRLSDYRRSCYSYFNDVYIDNWELRLGIPGNVLHFEVKEVERNE